MFLFMMTQQFQRLRLTSRTHPGQVSHWYFSHAIEYPKITCYPWPKRSRPRSSPRKGQFHLDLKDQENFTSVVVSACLVVSTSNFVSAKMAPVPGEFLTWC